jgi:L-fuculokinase
MWREPITGLAKLTDRFTANNMQGNVIIVLDCGATNVRAVAVNPNGKIVAMHSVPNKAKADPFYPPGLIWDIEEIWQKFALCTQSVSSQVSANDVAAIVVTTFGVNGAPVAENGDLLYPVISWQCQRTVPIMENIDKYISLERLYAICGVNNFNFNTINVLIWLKENHPEVLDRMHAFLFISSIFINRLTGNMINDYTMAGTSMLMDIKKRTLSAEILEAVDIPNRFADLAEAGIVAGEITSKAAKEFGLAPGMPVILAGHDTQFALIGSGAGENEAVLSSGTWEILMTRTRHLDLGFDQLKAGVTNELDAIPGLYNTGIQWLASGVLEWIKSNFYTRELVSNPEQVYDLMIQEAAAVTPNAATLSIIPDFANNCGSISGLGMHTSRGEIYRAALEALAEKTRQGLNFLQEIGQFRADSLIVVGGGAKNQLWNRIRANTLGIPLKLARQSETTVLGAAAFALTALGMYHCLDDAVNTISSHYDYIYPNNKT